MTGTARPDRFALCGVALLAVVLGWGAVAGAEPLEEIRVRAARVEKDELLLPAAVSVVEADDVQLARPQLNLGESLGGVPGVFFQNQDNYAQDLRLAIRGFGARAGFGIRGVKLLVDGIPATLPDGQSQVDDIDLSSVGRIEVLRGPSASLYGSAAGGVVRIETEEAPETPYAFARVGFGSWGQRSYAAKSAGRSGAVDWTVGLSRQQLAGYRDHSGMENAIGNARLGWAIDEDTELRVVTSFVYAPIADDPGGLTAAELAADRRSASPRNLQYDAGERVNQFRGGMSLRKAFDERNETRIATYQIWRELQNRLPFQPGGAVGFDRYFGGGSLQHVYTGEVFGLGSRLLVGFDIDAQRDERVRRDNRDGRLGDVTLEQREEVTGYRFFAQEELALREDLEISLAVGYDGLHYAVLDRFLGDGDDSGSRDFGEWSPMAGIVWRPLTAVSLYGRISTAFEPPTTSELANPSGAGGFNPDLEAQRAVNFEAGVRGLLPGVARWELVGFHVLGRDELVPYELASMPGRSFFSNAGRSRRSGLEAAVRHQPLPGLTASLVYTLSVFEYEEFRTAAGVFDGNRIPGIPEHQIWAELFYRAPFEASGGVLRSAWAGFYAGFELRWLGSFFADDANRVEIDSALVSNARLGWQRRFGALEVGPFVSVRNLTGELYNDNVRVNAAAGRYFEPAAERGWLGGLSLAWHFDAR